MAKKIVCFGEVLWDMLPSGKIAGGAPMNVAFRLNSLGIGTQLISRTGPDELGRELRTIIEHNQLPMEFIQEDPLMDTGVVQVQLDEKGSASYDIVYPSAWDAIAAPTEAIRAITAADALVFGSLVCRDERSKASLYQLLDHARYKIFDVNLRAPFYTFELIEDLMCKADFVKLNDEELLLIAKALGAGTNEFEAQIRFLAEHTQTSTICVTKGGDGAVLYIDGSFHSHPGFKVQVADTIGAGDSFLAGLIAQLVDSASPDKALEFACAIGALVASAKGANPTIDPEQIESLIKS